MPTLGSVLYCRASYARSHLWLSVGPGARTVRRGARREGTGGRARLSEVHPDRTVTFGCVLLKPTR